jgi:hypothetical protein
MDPAAFAGSPVGRLVPIKGRDQRWDEEFEDYAFGGVRGAVEK